MAAIVPAYAGADRGSTRGLLPAWLPALYEHSNFAFIGGYLAHWPLSAVQAIKRPKQPPAVAPWMQPQPSPGSYSGPNYHTTTPWGNIYPTIKTQGWGWVLFYLAYSMPQADVARELTFPKLPTVDARRDKGREHGIHIKVLAHDWDPEHAGCVVYVDNENNTEKAFSPEILVYYRALFEEMQTPGPDDLPAVRAGIYCHPMFSPQLFEHFPDLFVWALGPIANHPVVTAGPRRGRPARRPPFREGNDRVDLLLDDWLLEPIEYANSFGMPVGRQAVFWKGQSMPSRNLGPLTPLVDWDFDVSFVRDPRYPHANPRFCVFMDLVLRGNYDKMGRCMSADIPAISTALLGDALEPEAPLVMVARDQIYSINTSGAIVTTTVQDASFTAIQASSTHASLWYVTAQNSIVCRERTGGIAQSWTDAVEVPGVTTHPFSNVTSAQSAFATNVFYLDSNGLLCTSGHSVRCVYPEQVAVKLDKNAILLPGTALAAVCPTKLHTLAFGITRKLKLAMYVTDGAPGWKPPKILGGENDRICAHSRLAAFSPPNRSSVVYVAAISDRNTPCLYTIRFVEKEWLPDDERKAQRRFPKTSMGPEPSEPVTGNSLSAKTLDVNPFGEVALSADKDGTILWVTGVEPGNGAVLKRHIRDGSPWSRVG